MKTLLLIAMCIAIFTLSAYPQCRALKGLEYGENRRFSLPLKILDYDGHKISVSIITKDVDYLQEFPVDDLTEFPVGFEKNYKKSMFTVIYCADTRAVLWVQPFMQRSQKYETKAAQIKKTKKN